MRKVDILVKLSKILDVPRNRWIIYIEKAVPTIHLAENRRQRPNGRRVGTASYVDTADDDWLVRLFIAEQ